MRRLATGTARRLAVLAGLAFVGLSAIAAPALAGAQDTDTTVPAKQAPVEIAPDLAPFDVLEVTGVFDSILVNEVDEAIARAQVNGSQALVLQLNSKTASVSRSEMAALASRIKHSPVPVAIWVGPTKARALGLPGQLLGAAAVTAMAPGTRIGDFGEPLTVDGDELAFGDASELLRTGTLGFREAKAAGALKLSIADDGVVNIRNMSLALDGLQYNGTTLDTAQESPAPNGGVQRRAAALRFFKLGLTARLFHTVASVPVAYLLFIIGLALLVFEFFTAGVGVGGAVGTACLVLGCFGLASLPTRPLGVALLLLSFVAFAIDVQVGIPRFWTATGMILFTLGSVVLYRGLLISWITLLVGIGGIALTFVVGMPSMVRTRFSTPTIGREWLLGQLGSAVTTVSPEGVVAVGGTKWRARTNRATPLDAGASIRVVAIDGVTLEVEPETGGARDYRERRHQPADHILDEAAAETTVAATPGATTPKEA